MATTPTVRVSVNGARGASGRSAYELWLAEGNVGTIDDFFNEMVALANLTVTSATGQAVTTRALLAAIAGPSAGQVAYLSEAPRQGMFEWVAGDQSARVDADPHQSQYVPPNSDPTGASGVWARLGRDLVGIHLRDFGIKGDTANDFTTEFQNAIAQGLAENVARLIIPKGIIDVTKMTIPANRDSMKVIEFAGICQPSSLFGTINALEMSDSGSIIKSAASGDAIITAEPDPGAFPYNLTHVVFRDLNIRAYDNPAIDGLDMRWAGQCSCYNLQIDTDTYSVQASEPTNGGRGIIMPGNANAALSQLRNVAASGWAEGIVAGEHTIGDYLNLTGNEAALVMPTASHGAYFTRVAAQRNTYNVKVTGAHRFSIGLLNIEHVNPDLVGFPDQYTPANAWQVTVADIYDPSNLGIGEIHWESVLAGGAYDDITVDGGKNLRIARLGKQNEQAIGVFTRAAAQLIPNDTATNVSFDTTASPNALVAIKSGDPTSIVVQKGGIYTIEFACAFASNATGRRQVQLKLAGALIGRDDRLPVSGAATAMSLCRTINVGAGGEIQIAVYQSSGGALDLTRAPSYSMILTIVRVSD